MHRLVILAFASGCLTAAANPRPCEASADYRVYMAAEQLTVKLSTEAAELQGTFTFKLRPDFTPDVSRGYKGSEVMLQLPIWVPERDSKDPRVAAFWKAFPLQGERGHEPTRKTRRQVERALALRVALDGQLLRFNWFFTVTNRENVHHWAPKEWNLEPGYCCSIFEFEFKHDTMLTDKPVTVSYRQPLLHSEKGEEFFYLPVLKELPKGIDTNNYCISVVAGEGCYVTLFNGEQKAKLTPSEKIDLLPKHHQVIRAVVNSGANPQGRANGRQPFGLDTNRISAAAASRRSP